jgi:TonB-dependent starch-binding outer membrane protein SusC
MKKNECINRELKIPGLQKVLKIMKLTIFLVLLSVVTVFAGKTYSQTKALTLDVKNRTVKEVLKSIENQSEFVFMYSEKLIDVDREISVTLEDQKIDEVLNELFAGTDVNYRVKDRFILLATPEVSGYEFNVQQSRTVSGMVNTQSGEPLPGVTVVVKGTTQGTVTDAAGNYSISNMPEDATLVFSFMGMKTQEVAVGDQLTINLTMMEDAIGLEEVIAIGYGTAKKRDVSSSIASVKSDVYLDRPVSNFAQGIKGNVAGVVISNNNAAPGGGSNIVIRGISSVNASNAPLYVVDGQPLPDSYNKNESPINFINPADIESIEILKDAASGAIYGTRAANGVVLITTKRGKSGKPKVGVKVSYGVQNALREMDVLNSEDFIQFYEESRENAYVVEDPNFGTNDPNAQLWSRSDAYDVRIDNWKTYSSQKGGFSDPNTKLPRWFTVTDTTKVMASKYDTDWQDALFKTGNVTDVQLSLSGATDDVNYYVSGGYHKNKGIIENTSYDRFSFRSNFEGKINQWLTVGFNLAPMLENTSVLANSESTNTSYNPLVAAAFHAPIFPTHNDDGTLFYTGQELDSPWDWNVAFMVNPLTQLAISDERKTARVTSKLYSDIKFTEGLVLRTAFHNDYRDRNRDYFLPSYVPASPNNPTSRNRGISERSTRQFWDIQSYLNYNKTFGEHNINTMVGVAFEETNYSSNYIDKLDYPHNLITTLNQATTVLNQQNDARSNKSSESMIGTFARASYNFMGKYYLTGSVRRDGSSKFGPENRWAVFPSLSLAWRLSDERFMDIFSPFISDWKVRSGWGKIGNSGISNYLYASTLGASSYLFDKGSAIAPAYYNSKIFNNQLGWETTTDFGIGTDVSFFNSRVNLTADYFDRITNDMLFSLPLPATTGFGSVMLNMGSMKNRGFEYLLNTRNFTGKFKWTTTGTLSYYRNYVTDIGNDKRPIIDNLGYTSEGRPIANLWGMLMLGPYRDWEDVKSSPIFNPSRANARQRSYPGAPKAADVNGDGVLDANDKTVLGTPTPDFVWGLKNDFSYGNFDMSVMLNGLQGGTRIYGGSYTNIMYYADGRTNTTYEYFNNYWREDNPDAKYPAPNRKSYDSPQTEGGLVFDATFYKIENINLGYNVPSQYLRRASIASMRLYVNIDNVFLISADPGYNPESNYTGDNPKSQGVDRAGAYPLSRVYSFGINLEL